MLHTFIFWASIRFCTSLYIWAPMSTYAYIRIRVLHNPTGKRQPYVYPVYFLFFIWRSSYEEGTPHCRFRRKPKVLDESNLSVFGIKLLSCGIEPPLKFNFGSIAVLLYSSKERLESMNEMLDNFGLGSTKQMLDNFENDDWWRYYVAWSIFLSVGRGSPL
jgi:hypothetical protein